MDDVGFMSFGIILQRNQFDLLRKMIKIDTEFLKNTDSSYDHVYRFLDQSITGSVSVFKSTNLLFEFVYFLTEFSQVIFHRRIPIERLINIASSIPHPFQRS